MDVARAGNRGRVCRRRTPFEPLKTGLSSGKTMVNRHVSDAATLVPLSRMRLLYMGLRFLAWHGRSSVDRRNTHACFPANKFPSLLHTLPVDCTRKTAPICRTGAVEEKNEKNRKKKRRHRNSYILRLFFLFLKKMIILSDFLKTQRPTRFLSFAFVVVVNDIEQRCPLWVKEEHRL